MALSLSKLFAPCMLVLSSFNGLNRLPREFTYARSIFKLYLKYGCILFLHNCETRIDLSPIVEIVWIWCFCFGLPMISAEMCSKSAALPEFTHIHLIVPTYNIVMYHISPEHVTPYYLGFSHMMSLACLTILSITEEEVSYILLTLTYYSTHFKLSRYTSEYMENWCFFMTIANIISYRLLTRNQESE